MDERNYTQVAVFICTLQKLHLRIEFEKDMIGKTAISCKQAIWIERTSTLGDIQHETKRASSHMRNCCFHETKEERKELIVAIVVGSVVKEVSE